MIRSRIRPSRKPLHRQAQTLGPSSAPDTPAASDIIVAPDFDWVEMGETPEGTGTIQIDYEIKTGRE